MRLPGDPNWIMTTSPKSTLNPRKSIWSANMRSACAGESGVICIFPYSIAEIAVSVKTGFPLFEWARCRGFFSMTRAYCLRMQKLSFSRVPPVEGLLLCFLLFSVLWRGGKSLETTWMLVGVAGALVLADTLRSSEKIDPPSLLRSFGGARNGELRMENSFGLLWVCAFGFLAWTTLSYFFSTTRNYGLDEVLRDSALVLIFLWTMRHAGGESGARFAHRFIHTMTVAAVLGAFFGLLVYSMQPVNRFVGTFFDHRFHTDYWPNAWAQFVLLAWPMIVLWMRGRNARLQVAGCGLLGLVLGTLLLSYSRGAMIAFGGQIALLGLWEWVRRKSGGLQPTTPSLSAGQAGLRGPGMTDCGRMFARTCVVAVIAVALFFAANAMRGQFHPVQSIGEKVTFTADEGGSSINERKQFWKQSITLISERPLLGWGPYSFRFVHQRLQTSVLATSDHPHNIFLKLATERGIVAAILFAILVVVILWPMVALLHCCIVRKRMANGVELDQQYSNTAIQQSFLFIAVLGVVAHNLIDYNLQFVGIALPFWMMLGVLASANAKCTLRQSSEQVQDKAKKMNTKFVHKLELTVAVLLLTVALREAVFLVTSSIGRHAETQEDFTTALTWYDRSASEWFSRDMHLSRALLRTMQGETLQAQEAMDAFFRLNAEDPRGWRLQGDIARTKGNLEAAADAYAKAYELGRWNDLSIALALAEVLGESEQGATSSEQFSLEEMKPEMDALLGSFIEAIVRNAHFIALSHNAEDAIALSAFLAKQFPESAPRYEVFAARADFAMRAERAKLKRRPTGYLW